MVARKSQQALLSREMIHFIWLLTLKVILLISQGIVFSAYVQ